MRTLFIPQGLEEDRILAAIAFHVPDKVVFIRNTRDISVELTREVERRIKSIKKKASGLPFVKEWDELWVDFFSPMEAMVDIYDVLVREEDPRVDISSGNKLVSLVLALLASHLGVQMTYSSAGRYGKTPSFNRLIVLPRLPVRLEVDMDLVRIISQKREFPSISELARAYLGRDDKSAIMMVSRKLEVLEECGLVEVVREGRVKRVRVR